MAGFEKYTGIAALLSKAVRGQLTTEEEELLEKWRNENTENDLLYRKVRTPEFILSKSKRFGQVDLINAFIKVQDKQKRRAKMHFWRRISVVAASVCLILGGGLCWLQWNNAALQPVMAEKESILPGDVKAELILAGGERVWLGNTSVDSVWNQPGAELHVSGKSLSYTGQVQTLEEIQYNILQVPKGGEYSVTLHDGTVVYLNSASVLRYPVRFTGKQRKVFLSGEAYFQVAGDKEHPFIVETGGTETEVLGTHFNICSYAEEDHIETTLVEGAVRFSMDGREVVLTPGEQGVADKNGQVSKKKVDIYPYIAWKEGKFVFRKRSLEQVMRIISRWYNVEVNFEDEDLKEISFSGNLRRYDDFQHVIDMLEMTGGLQFKVEGKTIYIAGK